MAHDLAPSDRELCSQSTISRLENLPDVRALLRMGRTMIDLYCASFKQVPKRIVLDIDDTFDAVHGGQQLRLFNAHYDEYGFQPIVVFDGEGRFITAVLRPAKRPGGKEIRALLRRLLRAIRTNWPSTQMLLRADSHYCCPEVLDWCRANGLDYILGCRADHNVAPAHRGPRGQHEGALRGRAEGGQGAPLQGVLRRGRQLEPRRADRRTCRGQHGRPRHTIHRHQPEGPQRPCPLRGCLLPARPVGKPHQVLEDASGGRPHLVY
jgi:DDE family transposase